MAKYNWDELVSDMASRTGYTKVSCDDMLTNVKDTLFDIISEGNNVHMKDFGKFEVVERAARIAHNPKTGEEINVPAKKVVKFTPFSNLKENVELL